MYLLLKKIFATHSPALPEADLRTREGEAIAAKGKRLEEKIRTLFAGSLAIREIDAGSSNAEEQELNALSNPYYDLERFGIHFVASPRHADVLFVTGPVSRNMAEAVRRTYEATPDPKLVVAVGDGAIDGGIFRGSYAIVDRVADVIPVDYEIPGDPPSPSAVISALLAILEAQGSKRDAPRDAAKDITRNHSGKHA